MKKYIKVVVIVLIIVLISLILKFFMQPKNNTNTQIANPASVNCIKNNGKLSIVNKSEGQVGMCTFSNGTACEEWAYFRGECPKK